MCKFLNNGLAIVMNQNFRKGRTRSTKIREIQNSFYQFQDRWNWSQKFKNESLASPFLSCETSSPVVSVHCVTDSLDCRGSSHWLCMYRIDHLCVVGILFVDTTVWIFLRDVYWARSVHLVLLRWAEIIVFNKLWVHYLWVYLLYRISQEKLMHFMANK